MSRRVVFRVDASTEIGTGHVMRCLALAEALRQRQAVSHFICRQDEGNLTELVEQRGFDVVRLPKSATFSGAPKLTWMQDAQRTSEALSALPGRADWLVVDHYALDAAWERHLRQRIARLMVIDDLANRQHDCDVLLDQNYYEDLETRYDALVPSNCLKLLGPKHTLLRREFLAARHRAHVRRGGPKRILVFLGGADSENVTARAINAFTQLDDDKLFLDVVVGASNPRSMELEAICSALPRVAFHFQVPNISELMLAADLAVGAGGVTTWERCILGLPTLTIVIADNQLRTTLDMAKLGIIWYIGRSSELDADVIRRAMREALSNPARLQQMSEKAMAFMSQVPDDAAGAVATTIIGAAPK
jgi:UDP-2,4-diacetamido-2,4,6-trideoxy-beta-L-altropyranose hydrolase